MGNDCDEAWYGIRTGKKRGIYHLSVFRSRTPFYLPENFIEITGIIYATEPGDLLNGGGAVAEQLFGMGDFFCEEILDDRDPVLLFKFPAEIVFADKKLLGEAV